MRAARRRGTARGRGPAPRERIHLVSWAGFPNYGDELIAERWLRFLAEARPEAEVWLDTRFPGMTASLLGDLHPHLRATDVLFRTLDAVLRDPSRSIEELVADHGSPAFDLALQDLGRADTLHVLGGGFLHSHWPEHALLLDALREVSRRSGARLLATGQGLMPAGPAHFEGFAHVSVRDAPSAEHLGIAQGVDDAYLLPRGEREAARYARRSRHAGGSPAEVMVCIQDDLQDEGSFDRHVELAREALGRLDVPRERVRYVEAIPGADHPGYVAVRDLVAEDGFVPFADLWRDGLKMGPHQLWITTRFHHHLMASLHGARGMALAGRAGYYDVKHRSIAELGSRWAVVPAGGELPDLARLKAPRSFAAAVRAKREEARALYPR